MARFSMQNYSVPVWLSKNKDDIKLLIAAIGGVATYFISQVQPPEFNAVIAAVAAAVIKFVADAVDYWLSDTP